MPVSEGLAGTRRCAAKPSRDDRHVQHRYTLLGDSGGFVAAVESVLGKSRAVGNGEYSGWSTETPAEV